MINEFIEKTIVLLQRSDIQIRLPEHRKIEFEGNMKTVYVEVSEQFGRAKLKDNFIFHVMVFFSLIDAFIDTNYPDLEGQSFTRKYNNIPSSNDQDKIIKELFRILKILRNASVHSKNAIQITTEGTILINYCFKGTMFKIETSEKILELIYSLVFLFLIDDNSSVIYKEGLMRSYYDDICQGITKIEDNFGNRLVSISTDLRLKRVIRYVVANPRFNINGQRLIIEKYELNEIEKSYSSFDYLVNVESKLYIIPDELLGMDGDVDLTQIIPWENNGVLN